MKLLVLIPSRGLVMARTIQSIVEECENTPGISYYRIRVSGPGFTQEVRTELIQCFKNSDFDAALWCDDDMEIPQGVLKRLLDTPGDIVGTHACNRVAGKQIHKLFVYPDNMRVAGDGKTIDFCSLAVALMRRRVVEVMQPPWFQSHNGYNGEDMFFNQKAKQAGVVFNHIPVIVPHYELSVFRGKKTVPLQTEPVSGPHQFIVFGGVANE